MTPEEMLLKLLKENFYIDEEHGLMWKWIEIYGLKDIDPDLNKELEGFLLSARSL